MRIDKRSVGFFLGALAIVVALQLFIQGKAEDKDVKFCRNLFIQLVKGSADVAGFIDWEHFRALESDIGAEYIKLTDSKDKADYRNAFVKAFAVGFNYFNGRANIFTNWRVYSRNDERIIIACEHARYHKTFLFTFSKSGQKKKLISLEMKK